jgi:hypothetical protein
MSDMIETVSVQWVPYWMERVHKKNLLIIPCSRPSFIFVDLATGSRIRFEPIRISIPIEEFIELATSKKRSIYAFSSVQTLMFGLLDLCTYECAQYTLSDFKRNVSLFDSRSKIFERVKNQHKPAISLGMMSDWLNIILEY